MLAAAALRAPENRVRVAQQNRVRVAQLNHVHVAQLNHVRVAQLNHVRVAQAGFWRCLGRDGALRTGIGPLPRSTSARLDAAARGRRAVAVTRPCPRTMRHATRFASSGGWRRP
jgi:hypothetical protein